MTTVTIDLPDQQAAALTRQAAAQGISLADLIRRMATEPAPGSIDWSQCSAVESVPGKVSGAWVLTNTRMPVPAIFENLEARSHTINGSAGFDRAVQASSSSLWRC